MKMNRVMMGAAMIFLLSATTVSAAEPAKPGPWEKINEKDGIVIYARNNPRVSFKEVRCVGVVNSSVANLENMMRDWDAYKKVLFMSKKTDPAEIPGCNPKPDTYCAYLLQGFPWPVEDRDGYGSMNFYYHKPTGELLVRVVLVNSGMPLVKGVTRIPFCEMEWIVKPIDATHSEVTYQNMIEPGGAVGAKIPTTVINYILKSYGVFTLQNVRKLAKQDKYQHAKGIITQQPWPAELRFYAEDVPGR